MVQTLTPYPLPPHLGRVGFGPEASLVAPAQARAVIKSSGVQLWGQLWGSTAGAAGAGIQNRALGLKVSKSGLGTEAGARIALGLKVSESGYGSEAGAGITLGLKVLGSGFGTDAAGFKSLNMS